MQAKRIIAMYVLTLEGIDEHGLAILREAGLEVTAQGKMNEEELKEAIRALTP